MANRLILLSLLFCYMSFNFLTKFSKSKDNELSDALKTFSGEECPSGITLYRLKSTGTLFRIQMQEKLPHNVGEKTSLLKKCEAFSIHNDNHDDRITSDNLRNLDHGHSNTDLEVISGYEDVDDVTLGLLEELCETSDESADPGSNHGGLQTDALISNPFMAYMLQVVKGPEPVPVFENTTDTWSYLTFISGIFPGTLWCGFGNMAEDMYDQVGEHSATDDCCRSHDLCKPMIKAFQTRYYYSNPSVLPISHCGCDSQFYSCLLRVNSPASKVIGRIFFNLVKMKCFDFNTREVCVSSFLGLCKKRQEKCVAILRSNKLFLT